MSDTLTLRPYQLAAIEAVDGDLAALQRVAVVKPTGTGKTVTMAEMARRLHAAGQRSIILVHRDELVSQTVRKLGEAGLPDIGIVKAAWNDVAAPVIVASVQTLASVVRRERLISGQISAGPIRRVIVDECHHATAPTYIKTLEALDCFDPLSAVTAVGFTATMSRADGIALGKVWQKVSYQMDILDAIRDGYLIDARGIRVTVESLRLADVKKSGGDYQDEALGAAMIDADVPEAAAKAWIEHAGAEDCGIAFWPNVASAEAHAEALRSFGIAAVCISGRTPLAERRAAIADAYAGRIQVITNCGVATEGFDWPQARVVMIARPTTSQGLYVQMVGRVLRPYPGQREALVIDVVGVGAKLRLAGMADLAGVDVPAGKSMVEAVAADAVTRAEDDERSLAAQLTLGKLHATEFDLFGGSRRAWQRTHADVWFLPAGGDHLVFLAPGVEVGRFDVCEAPIEMPADPALRGRYVKRDLDLSYAMSWAEQTAAERSVVLADRKAKWRQKPASTALMWKADQLGVDCTYVDQFTGATMIRNMGELVDEINLRIACDRIDHMPVVVDSWLTK